MPSDPADLQSPIHEEFKEVEETTNIIESIPNIYDKQIPVELAVERFTFIMDQYQEQPHLLDPHLELLLSKLLSIVRTEGQPSDLYHLAFKLIYLVTKTRGFKVVVRLMPHEVADLEPLLALLAKQDPLHHQTWETRYVLLLWLSLVCMIPFDMTRLDSNQVTEGQEVKKPIMDRIIDACKVYINVSDKSRDAASYTLAQFMTRPDVTKQKLAEFVDWTLVSLQKTDRSTMTGVTTACGLLSSLALLFKFGKRDDLLKYAPIVLKFVISSPRLSSSPLLTKLNTKLIQRLGLTFLQPRLASWRYQRGSRILVDNLEKKTSDSSNMELDDDSDSYDIPDETEDVIEYLLSSLKDKETVVRWSAAKGVGRVVGRLHRDLADEVLASIMELFSVTETDAAWHGGCLALAELGRRGFLLPARLPEVVPVVVQSLLYDVRKGNFSVGAHVRDAACYVCWAFARAYDPAEIKPYVHDIANALIITFLFDRQASVRSAAAAAFQENVGRQGQFAHGIDILTRCDYYAVRLRTNCYLNLSVFVADFDEYTVPLIDHLVQVKSVHFDHNIRQLSAECLELIAPKAEKYVTEKVVPVLLQRSTGPDVTDRHGSILALATVILSLSKENNLKNRSIKEIIGEKNTQEVEDITKKLKEHDLYKGFGGELMRKASCTLISKLSQAHLRVSSHHVTEMWLSLMEDCLQHREPDVQEAAVMALPAFFTEYCREKDDTANKAIQERVIGRCLSELGSTVEYIRMGHACALGALPAFMLHGRLDTVINRLIEACNPHDKDAKMCDARKDAVNALTRVCLSVGIVREGPPNMYLCESNLPQVYEALFTALTDYTLDSRGDVGSWVREVSMSGLSDITSLLITSGLQDLISPDRTRQLFCCLVQQATEKIDRTRALAGEIFYKLLHHSPAVPHIPHRQKLITIFSQSEFAAINWGVPATTFPLFTRLLSLDAYRYNILLGLSVSVGGLTESLVKSSSSSLHSFVYELQDKDKLDQLTTDLLLVLENNHKLDRLSMPFFKMVGQMFDRGCFALYEKEPDCTFITRLYELSQKEIAWSTNIHKLLASIDVFCSLLQYNSSVRQNTFFQLMKFLGHHYPIVRKTAAGKLYETVLTYDDLLSDENADDVMILLSETEWDRGLTEVRPIRDQLCDLLGVSRPVMKRKPKTTQP